MNETIVQRGPAIDRPVERSDTQLTASFRVLLVYDIYADQHHTRMDVLINNDATHGKYRIGMDGDQFCGVITSLEESDLIVPNNGIVQGFGVKAHPQDIINLLRGLADALDKTWKR